MQPALPRCCLWFLAMITEVTECAGCRCIASEPLHPFCRISACRASFSSFSASCRGTVRIGPPHWKTGQRIGGGVGQAWNQERSIWMEEGRAGCHLRGQVRGISLCRLQSASSDATHLSDACYGIWWNKVSTTKAYASLNELVWGATMPTFLPTFLFGQKRAMW